MLSRTSLFRLGGPGLWRLETVSAQPGRLGTVTARRLLLEKKLGRDNFDQDSARQNRPSRKQGKEHWGTQGAASRRWTAGLGNTASQARTPNRAKRGALAGIGGGRARASPTVANPGRAGRTCSRGSSRANPLLSGRGARAPPKVKTPKPQQRIAVLSASEGRRGRGAVGNLQRQSTEEGTKETGTEEGTKETWPQETEGGGQRPEVGQKGTPGS